MKQDNFLSKFLSQLNSTLAVICLMLVGLGNAQANKVPGFESD